MPEVRERLGMVRNTVSYVRQEVQRTIWDVESPLLEGAALPEALHNFSKFIDTEGASVGVEVFGLPMTLRPSVSHNLLRVAQEATANAIRHGKATRIAIRLHYNKTHVILEVEDDGTGFVADGILQKAGHLGLRGMGTRVKKLGGKFSITSTLQAGTSIRAVIPHSDPKPHGESQS
jgi:signal transduction histidine kinase